MEITLTDSPPEAIVKQNPDGSNYIPINNLEDELDKLGWGTRNFSHFIFKNGYADLVVSASLELLVDIEEDGVKKERSFVGCANFSLKSIDPNQHFLATAKSECIKNAASDIGKYFGRGINDEFSQQKLASSEVPVERPKVKADAGIMKKFLKAVEENDTATQTMLSNIYEIKTA